MFYIKKIYYILFSHVMDFFCCIEDEDKNKNSLLFLLLKFSYVHLFSSNFVLNNCILELYFKNFQLEIMTTFIQLFQKQLLLHKNGLEISP